MSDTEPFNTAITIAELRRFVAESSQSRAADAGRRVLSLLEKRQGPIDESCEVTSHAVSDTLRAAAFLPVIVEGELELGPYSWLQHRVVVVELPEEWLVIDVAVRQVPAFRTDEIFWAVVPPDATSLTAILSNRYGWWSPP
ncbi:MAG: hypothetical protein ABI837_05005 [Acidobacteriota bacterium]